MDPLVPGSFTYSSFGGGAWGASGEWLLFFLESVSKFLTNSVGGRSSDRREANAALKNRGSRLCGGVGPKLEGAVGKGELELLYGRLGSPEVDGRGVTPAVVAEGRVQLERERARGLHSLSGIVREVDDAGEPIGAS